MRLLDARSATLRPGAPIVLETINPACWYAFFSSYIRDLTHVRPVHPETLQYLLRASGFERVEIRYRVAGARPGEAEDDRRSPRIVRVVGRSVGQATLGVAGARSNANAAILNRLMFGYMDYAVVGRS